jgi:hypothetical protein
MVDVKHAADAAIAAVPSEKWRELAAQRIFFAHKSVGYNIVEGLKDLVNANPQIGLKLAETRTAADLATPLLAHASNGLNGDPAGKILEFRKAIEGGLGDKLDIAFVKLCWADFTPSTDVHKLFEEYRAAMEGLNASYPDLTVVHFTVPLTVVQSGAKALVKRVLGRPVFGYEENIARNQFNELVLREYEGKEPVFDLAAWESTMPDGRRREYIADGRAYPELIPEFTPDSGHLNEQGRRWVAAQLLAFLASLPSPRVSD